MGYKVRDGYNSPDGYGFQGESAVVPAAVYPSNPLHVWHLDEAPGPFEDAVTEDTDIELSITGEDLAQIAGVHGFALSSQTTNPSILLSLGDQQIPAGADFSISLWMRLSAGLDVNSGAPLWSSQSDTQGFWVAPLGSGNKLQYNFAETDSPLSGINSITNNTWFNVTLTYKHSTKSFKAYANGIIDASTTLAVGFDSITLAQYFTIGPSDGLAAPNYDFDEMAAFDRELTQEEVTALQTAFYPY